MRQLPSEPRQINAIAKEVTIQLTDRIEISPDAAKRLSALLGGVVKEYESRCDALNIEAGAAQAK